MFRFLKKAFSFLFPFNGIMPAVKELVKEYRQLRVHADSVRHDYREMRAGLASHTDMLDASGGFVWRKDANGGYLFANRPVRYKLLAPHMHKIDPTRDSCQALPAKTDAGPYDQNAAY